MNRKKDDEETSLERRVRLALVAKGMAMPRTEAEVAMVEQLLEDSRILIPQKLREPSWVFVRRDRRVWSGEAQQVDLGVEDDFRRAAREGTALSSEIEARMRRDRELAEPDPDE